MRAPNPAESLSPFPNTQIANQIFSPASPEVRTPHRLGRAIGRASVVLTTVSLASIGVAAGSEPTHSNAGESRASAASSHRLDNVTRVAHESQNIYTGRVTIAAASRRAKTEREPSVTTAQSDGVTVGKIMGIPAANITQGKNSEVSIGGRKVDLAKYTTTHRKAEAWTDVRDGDCLWNFAAQDIGVAAIEAGQTQEQAKAAMNNPKNIKRVMAGYLVDNPELKANPNLVLTGKKYVAKHAREEADELVAAMRAAAQSPEDIKPAPNAVKPQPDTKTPVHTNPVHTAPRAENKSGFKDMTIAATKVLSGALLAVGALVGVGGGAVGLMRRRRRRQEEAAAEAAASSPTGKHRPPDGSGEPAPEPYDFSDLKKITEDDEKHGRDPIDPPTDARTVGTSLGRSPYAPPAEPARAAVLHAAPTAPDDIRARFGTPRLIDRPIDRRRLRSTPVSGVQNDTVVSIRRAFAQAPTIPEANIKDAPTDPAGANVYSFRNKAPQKARGWFDPKTGAELPEYRGAHRRQEEPTVRVEHIVPQVGMHRPAYATDISVAV